MLRFVHLFSVRETGIALVATAAFGLFGVLVAAAQAWTPGVDLVYVDGEMVPLRRAGAGEADRRSAGASDRAGDDRPAFGRGPGLGAGWPPAGFLFPIAPVEEAAEDERRCLVTDSFGDPRSGGRRSHAGVDIMAPKLEPVVAVADGVVRRVWDEREGDCCAVSIEHEGGWRTRYIHLNNDSPGRDDGLVVGVAPGLDRGVPVRRGQVIGWVGDSGNAEATSPHLHFELRDPDGEPVDPYPLLVAIDAGC